MIEHGGRITVLLHTTLLVSAMGTCGDDVNRFVINLCERKSQTEKARAAVQVFEMEQDVACPKRNDCHGERFSVQEGEV